MYVHFCIVIKNKNIKTKMLIDTVENLDSFCIHKTVYCPNGTQYLKPADDNEHRILLDIGKELKRINSKPQKRKFIDKYVNLDNYGTANIRKSIPNISNSEEQVYESPAAAENKVSWVTI